MAEPDVTAGRRLVVLLARPGTDDVLVRDGPPGPGPRLPEILAPHDDELLMGTLIDLAGEAVGGRVVPMRIMNRALDADRRATLTILEAEPQALVPGDGLRWGSAAELRGTVDDGVRDTLDWWLERGRDGEPEPPLVRSAWTRPGWFARASAWMLDRMTAAGAPPTGPAEVVYEWPLAIVLRAPSAAGPCFLKCAAGIFAHEATITAALAEATPAWVPEVVAVDAGENWLLMHDLGADVLGAEAPAAWTAGLLRLADLQRAWSGSTDGLERAGAPRRTLARLHDELAGFPDAGDLGARLGPETLAAWPAAVPRLRAACERLAGRAIADTLVHGDLHPWNVARTPRGLVVFDWSDGAVGHPFVDLATFVGRTRTSLHAGRWARRTWPRGPRSRPPTAMPCSTTRWSSAPCTRSRAISRSSPASTHTRAWTSWARTPRGCDGPSTRWTRGSR